MATMGNKLRPEEPGFEVKLTVPKSKLAAFNEMLDEFWTGESKWDAMQVLRKQRRELAVESLRRLFEFAEQNDCGGSRVIAMFLASLYNGYRFHVDLTDLRLLSSQYRDDMLNVLYLDGAPEQEVHCYFQDGGKRFERLFERYGLPDRDKVTTHLEGLENFQEESLQAGLDELPHIADRLRNALKAGRHG
ncbi:hypothetical protein RA210_U10402 [Rubrivivax sp. A210]|uniref:DUF7673 family protein n=1 Tax=Rubrivivax sp. A210 TaxID=2772301 RepID=UPI00191B1A93|nr:hypothetical protein [Rubrivivax sp. A210]CAD5366592.1 hypothetical protein RA210_U10402 [Rubrivivax sp. A210]